MAWDDMAIRHADGLAWFQHMACSTWHKLLHSIAVLLRLKKGCPACLTINGQQDSMSAEHLFGLGSGVDREWLNAVT